MLSSSCPHPSSSLARRPYTFLSLELRWVVLSTWLSWPWLASSQSVVSALRKEVWLRWIAVGRAPRLSRRHQSPCWNGVTAVPLAANQAACPVGCATNRSARCPHFIMLIICGSKMASVVFHLTQPSSCPERKRSQLTLIIHKAKNKIVRQTLKNSMTRRVLTRGFQIWSQNSNRKTFNPLFGPKRSKAWWFLENQEIP